MKIKLLQTNTKKGKGNVHGIGGPLPGDPSRNPAGLTFNDPPRHVAFARFKAGVQIGDRRNTHGNKGCKGIGSKRRKRKMKRSKEGLRLALEHREIQEIAKLAAPDAIKAIIDIVNSPEAADTAKIAAANFLLDRAYGKPTQTNVNANIDSNDKPREIDRHELDRRIKQTIERVERITTREAEAPLSTEGPSDLRKLN